VFFLVSFLFLFRSHYRAFPGVAASVFFPVFFLVLVPHSFRSAGSDASFFSYFARRHFIASVVVIFQLITVFFFAHFLRVFFRCFLAFAGGGKGMGRREVARGLPDGRALGLPEGSTCLASSFGNHSELRAVWCNETVSGVKVFWSESWLV